MEPLDEMRRRLPTTAPLGPFSWRVNILRATPDSVVTSCLAHLRDDQGRPRCGLLETSTRTKPASISARRCEVCADDGEGRDIWRDPAASIERLRAASRPTCPTCGCGPLATHPDCAHPELRRDFDTPMALDAEAWEDE